MSPYHQGRWWYPFAAGAVAGLLTGVWIGHLGRDGDPGRDDASGGNHHAARAARASGEGERLRLAQAWDGAVETLVSAREFMLGSPELDLEALRVRVEGLPGGDGVRLRSLGRGLVELVGNAPDDEVASGLLGAVAAEPGVEVVVNRIWTPSSAGGQHD